MLDPNETVVLSEGDSLISYQDHNHQNMEVKVKELEYLKEELQFHEEMVTNLLEEDLELKQQLSQLKEENERLR